ncbi:helix-turn-helix transcriptional regulator [Ruminococcus sp. KGMB03662]|nr:helix-turn-helix transcriptional regulator [Ruminococcus sp. KGMB03662]
MYETFAKLLSERGVTTYKVAQDTGLSQTMFSDWKSGKSKPKVDKLKVLADYFNVSLETFVE